MATLNIKISDNSQRMLTELQVRLSTGSKRINQATTIEECLEVVYALPMIHKCNNCGHPIAGIGVCSEECYLAYTGSKYKER